MKICTRCKQKKPFEAFPKNYPWADGYRPDCKECRNAYTRERIARLGGRQEMTARRHKINAVLYREILEIQGNHCPLCGDPPDPKARALAIDHDHQTDRLRGILCARCNGGLGMFRDSPVILRRAADYLEFWRDGWKMFDEAIAYVETYGKVEPECRT
jgi:hypothetical protein